MIGAEGAPIGFRPEFLWDADRLRLTWANRDGLTFWGEDSLIDLVERMFAPGDETVRALAARLAEITEGAGGVGRLTLYPQGEPVWAMADCRLEARPSGRIELRIALSGVEQPDDGVLIRMRAGFDVAPRPLAIFNEQGDALARNEADRRAFPRGLATLTDRYEDAAHGRKAMEAALSDGGYSHTALLKGVNGPARQRLSLRRMRDPVSGKLAVIADFADISDRPKSTPSNAVPDAKIEKKAVAKLAHDFRSPLNAIRGFAEFMAMSGDSLSAERQAQYLADIQTACDRMLGLTDQLVAMGVSQPEDTAPTSQIDLAQLAKDAVRLHEGRAQQCEVSLICDAQPTSPITADRLSVERIIQNLIENALTHGARAGGTTKVSAGNSAQGPWIEVSDDGPGAASTGGVFMRKSNQPGGLGLANAQELAATIGAQLVITTAPSSGFTARLIFTN
ncbi:MAG: sensor histidine kinase [Pikeienuella sp.]